ncbi:MAG: histidine phosphatase family protein [Phycisphaerae bacterium]|nr:histidine phosphatase family protein [Gemmatimonadaceae bacterium]
MRAEAMPEIVLVRHAAATGQEANAALTIEGQRQARLLADLLLTLQIQRVISSPYIRATESVRPFCRLAQLRLETDDRLVERNLSARNVPDWREHLRRSFDDPDYCLEDGETSRAAQARGTAAVGAALASGARCVLVTHGNLLALILKSVDETVGFDLWAGLTNPDVFVLHIGDDGKRGFSRVWP